MTDILSQAQAMTEAQILAGLPDSLIQRLKTEEVTPLVSALGLSDLFWMDSPHKAEKKEASRAARMVSREDAIVRALAWYIQRGGTDIEETQAFFERTFAPSAHGDGLVRYES